MFKLKVKEELVSSPVEKSEDRAITKSKLKVRS